MGKRSSYERHEDDFYPTPRKPVLPLIPHLRGVRRFAEPCAGDGALVEHLEAFGLRCVYRGDIRTGQDALARDNYGPADAIITNPPYARKLMHRLIVHFQTIAPTWLLLESAWPNTWQAEPFMPSCSDIVAIGRVKWIPDTKSNGTEDFAWCRFDARHNAGPVFHWLTDGLPGRRRRCAWEGCGKSYVPQRTSSRYCSDGCRIRAFRQRLRVAVSVTE